MGEWSFGALVELANQAMFYGCHIDTVTADKQLVIKTGRLPRDSHGAAMFGGVLGTWHRSGMPTLSLTEAALREMCAEPPNERPIEPWRAWVIKLPKDQRELVFVNRAGVPESVRLVIGVCIDRVWNGFALGARVEYALMGRTAEQLRDGYVDGLNCIPEPDRMEMQEVDHISARKLQLLLLGSAASMGRINGIKRNGPERAAFERGRYPAGDYEVRT